MHLKPEANFSSQHRFVAGTMRRYCYLHGYVTHSGPDCHEMKLDPSTYTTVKVTAKDHLTGGSKRNL